MAKKLGIEMNECRVIKKDGLSHFMTKRFDRVNGEKLHMQTLAALCHYDYNTPNICSYEEYAMHARKLGIGLSGIEQIFKRMVFAVMGMNCDDHVKNFSFLMDKAGKWTLAPAYDLTFAYNPGNRWISSHQMAIGGKIFDISKEDMIECGKKMGLPAAFCRKTVEQTESVIGDWMNYAHLAGISEQRALEVQRMLVK